MLLFSVEGVTNTYDALGCGERHLFHPRDETKEQWRIQNPCTYRRGAGNRAGVYFNELPAPCLRICSESDVYVLK
jgi:hypothetical protein